MQKNENYTLKPIRFSYITHVGEGGFDIMQQDFYLLKLIVQNILYITYHKPRTLNEISELIEVSINVIEEIVIYLVNNGFIEVLNHVSNRNIVYVTKMLIHDLSDEVTNKMNIIYKEYAAIICDKYIIRLFNELNFEEIFNKIYVPYNDLNFLMWNLVMLTCCKKLDIPEINNALLKHYIKRSDGGDFISTARVERNDILFQEKEQNRLIGQSVLSTSQIDFPCYLWICNTFFDDRLFTGINTLHLDFYYTYDYIKNNLKNNSDNTDIFERLYNSGFLRKTDSDKIDVNLIVTTFSKNELLNILPDMPNDFIEINKKMSEELYNTCKNQYPEHIQELCHDFYLKSITNPDFIKHIFLCLLDNNYLKPLLDYQMKTVNMIMYSDILCTNS